VENEDKDKDEDEFVVEGKVEDKGKYGASNNLLVTETVKEIGETNNEQPVDIPDINGLTVLSKY